MVLDRAQAAPLVMSVIMEEAPVCRHHWIIEPANGRHSQGECQNCHKVRTFRTQSTKPRRLVLKSILNR